LSTLKGVETLVTSIEWCGYVKIWSGHTVPDCHPCDRSNQLENYSPH